MEFYAPETILWALWMMIVICLVVILYKKDKTVAFYIKYSAYLLSFSLIAILTIPLMLLNPGSPRNIRIPGFFSRWIQAPLAGVRTTVLKERDYPEDQSFVVVCNHQSALDSLAMMEIFPDNCAVVVKKSWLYASPYGLAALLAGAIFIGRGKNPNKMEVLQNVVDIIHEKRCQVWFFPEGTRKLSTRTSEEPLLHFKKGAFNIAVLAQIPVVPVVLSSQEAFFNYTEKIFKPGRIVASILAPIPTTDLTIEDVPQLTDNVRAIMMEEFNRISE